MQVEFIKTFRYGSSVRTLFRMSRPMSDRTPARSYVLRVYYRGFEDQTNWLAAYSSGEVMCFSPPCASDMEAIEAAVSVAHITVQ